MSFIKKLPSFSLVLLILVILTASIFALLKLQELRSIERSPFIAIVSTNLGIKPKLLNIQIKTQSFLVSPSKRSLKTLETTFRINRASILNDLNSEETQNVHNRLGDLNKLNQFVESLNQIESFIPESVSDVKNARNMHKKVSRIYQKWNVYSRSFIQKTQVVHDQFLSNLDKALTILLIILIVIGATSILASLLIYRQYTHQKSLSNKLLKQTIDLTEARNQAEEGMNEKSRFLSNISHELRTPLNGVIGLSNLAYLNTTDLKTKSYLRDIKKSGDLLLSLINNVLDINKIDSGGLEVENKAFDLWELLNTLGTSLYNQASIKNIYFIILLSPDVPRTVTGDETRINQVLINLVSNAIKFTEVGGVTISIYKCPSKPNKIKFEIKDTGIGIAEEAHRKIFNEFSQEDESTTRRFGGTGLGLSISKRLIQNLGGELQLNSAPDRGSCFYFDLPLIQDRSNDTPYKIKLDCDVITTNNTLEKLVTEDLNSWGINLLPNVKNHIYFPSSNTIKLNDQQLNDTKKLFIFSNEESIESLEHIDSKRCFYIHPPYAAYKILMALEEHQSKQSSTDSDCENTALILNNLHIMIVEDTPLNQVVSQEFTEALGARVSLAENGMECLTLLENDTFDLILMDIHMPILDGIETTKRIRSMNKFKKLPIIALTANVIQEDVDKYFEVGMNAYLAKPFNQEDFIKTIQETLSSGL